MLSFETEQSIFYTRKTMTAAETSIIPDFRQVIDDWQLTSAFEITATKITNIQSGSIIHFMGLTTSNGENSAKMKGLSQATIWVTDEAEEVTNEDLFNKAQLSLRSKRRQNKIIVIMNPSTKEHFIYQRFFEQNGVQPGSNLTKNNTTYIHTTYMDNIDNLEEGYIGELLDLKRRAPKQFNHIVLGGWRERAEGIIYTNWTVGQPDLELAPVFGYDDGYSPDPAAFVETRIDRKRKKIYLKELLYHTQMVESEKVSLIKRYAGSSRVWCEHNLSIIESCRRAGINAEKAQKGPGSVLKGISLLQDYELVIHPDSTNMIKEANNYIWNPNKSDTPVDKWNHLWDAVRYSVSDLFEFSEPTITHRPQTRHMRPQYN